jgi:predicted 3-demethylubiquinone-9 3-methyltransferase (glyoxalase superfamily)
MQKITPYLWFESQAEEAAEYYVSIFDNSRVVHVERYGEAGPVPAGTAMNVVFELEGQQFIGLNGGPGHEFSDAVSFYVSCETQDEVDALWDKLTADGGEPGPCGWLKDRFGLSWQIVPGRLPELLADPDQAAAQRVMGAMLGMQKIQIKELEAAYAG